ncbi:hypothetical protein SAMN04488040_2817 [Sulfitobacter marinus]|uniref:Uncharacterized protein n=1 Tax=Sulfitobacter marinus TaxID=394264 RepID=A0A1I6UL78_9RHOB|nr:hypothetical protein [Sulfitobacter marinus]SFT02180.1 hypothetical protein SAMN04488040_2817 [Sulfitobacter marinus]
MTRAPLSPARTAAMFRRDPVQVMQLARLGLAHPTRLSFLRILLRRMQRENWRFDRPLFDIDANGVGRAVYRAIGSERTYSLVAFAHDLPADLRSDRVIATAWDATFALHDGTPDAADLGRLAANVPLQEAGRVTQKELTLSRANRSVRLFDHVVQCLSEGRQPDSDDLAATGYLMRTTAVYGSGKFGAATHRSLSERAETAAPFQAEMLTVWLIRAFTVDLVNHMARDRGGAMAVPLADGLRRILGVGNSTGLGMAPFLVRHPILLNNWMMVREEALARVRAQQAAMSDTVERFGLALMAAQENAAVWTSAHPLQQDRLTTLRSGLDQIAAYAETGWDRRAEYPWDALWHWGQTHLETEAQEALLSLMLEPHGHLIDGLEDCLSEDEAAAFAIDGSQQIGALKTMLARNYDWALEVDYTDHKASGRFWYVSEDKLEPRLGERFDEPGNDRELPLDIGRQAAALHETLESFPATAPIAELLLAHPEHRSIVRRVQLTAARPFAEIRDNLIDANMLPIDMLRCKLACFGASRFDPRSDRWVRISLFQNAPYPDDLHVGPDL